MTDMIVMDAGDGTHRVIEADAIRALIGFVEQRDGLPSTSLIGQHTLNPTTDPTELATRATCAEGGHPAVTYNPVHDATWCRCGAVVVAGDHGVLARPERVTGEAPLHRRYVRVLGGSLNDWVGVAEAPLEAFETNLVDGRRVEADDRCTYDCPCQG